VTFDAVTSPPNSESDEIEVVAVEVASVPTCVEADAVTAPVATTEASDGYANPDVIPTASGGADTEVEIAPV
jgi:hypothetical protein